MDTAMMPGTPQDRCFDPGCPAAWAQRRLRYSRHALERAEERAIPLLTCLPPDSRLADLDKTDRRVYAVVFKVPEEGGGFFLVLSPDGCVLTVFRKGMQWKKCQAAKERRRRLAMAA